MLVTTSKERFSAACGPVSFAGRTVSIIRLWTCWMLSLVLRTSGAFADTHLDVRLATPTTDPHDFIEDASLDATKTHSAPHRIAAGSASSGPSSGSFDLSGRIGVDPM